MLMDCLFLMAQRTCWGVMRRHPLSFMCRARNWQLLMLTGRVCIVLAAGQGLHIIMVSELRRQRACQGCMHGKRTSRSAAHWSVLAAADSRCCWSHGSHLSRHRGTKDACQSGKSNSRDIAKALQRSSPGCASHVSTNAQGVSHSEN